MTRPRTDPTRRLGWNDVLARAPASGRVLLVEDQAEVRSAMEKMITRLGYSVRGASSAEQADQWLVSERFDVCLLDIQLPRMTGLEFLDWAQSRDPEMAVIMTTGIDVPEVAVQCLDHGARTYLVKPIEATFLRLALRDALAMRGLLSERNDLSRD